MAAKSIVSLNNFSCLHHHVTGRGYCLSGCISADKRSLKDIKIREIFLRDQSQSRSFIVHLPRLSIENEMFCHLLSLIVAANMVLVDTGETNRNKRSNMRASALERLRIHLTRLETKIDQFAERSKADVQTVQTDIVSQCMNYSKQDADRVIAAVERIALSHEENITSSVQKNVSEALVQVLKLWDAHFCMGGYTHYNLSCYRLVRQNLTWEAAENYCQYSGAHLLWFETDGEHEFLKKLLKNEGMNGNDVVWTGGLDASQSQKWAYPQDSSNTTLLKYFGNVTVRLVKVNSIPYSRVEVYLKQFGGWGPIYDNGWDKNDADVVCRQLGFNDSESAVSNLVDGSNGRYFSTNMNCSGSESNLGECRHNGWEVSRFGSNNAAGVICRYEPAGQPTYYKVRLVGGQRYNEGRVEVRQYSYSSWGLVCDYYWDSYDAKVAIGIWTRTTHVFKFSFRPRQQRLVFA